MLTPHLPVLVAEAARRKAWTSALLDAATAAAEGDTFVVDGSTFQRRTVTPPRYERDAVCELWIQVIELASGAPLLRERGGRRGGLVNVTKAEADGFWAWAIVETLRHTGIRIEELLELTQLSLRHYTAESTGTLVPLLHIVPSKTDAERLVPMSPELVAVLVEVLRRAKGGDPQVPLSVRYDPYEKVHGEPFPHLFARRIGARQEVMSHHVVRRLLNELAGSAGLQDAGAPITFTPHDSGGCSRPRWSPPACPCTSQPPCSATSTSTPPAATPRSSPRK